MRLLHVEELPALARGAIILGSGGGGCPSIELLQATHALNTYGPVTLIDLEELDDDDFVMPVGFMGAPVVGIEKLPTGEEIDQLVDMVEETMGKRVTVILLTEIGGANALAPLIAAAKRGLPVLDADTLGRAFPRLQLNSCNLYGISPSPAFMINGTGNRAILYPKDADALESQCRALCCAMGMTTALTMHLMSGKEARKAVIPKTVSQALEVGAMPRPGKVIASGTIVDIKQQLDGGFLKGHFVIEECDRQRVQVVYQNEYLLAKRGDEQLACAPEIFAVLEHESDEPIPTDRLRYGLRVDLAVLPAPQLWTTPEGYALVGPHAFNLEEAR